jgi:hypothetical protein
MVTSDKEASQAGKDLRDPKTPKKDRGPIGAALAQAAKHGRKGKGSGSGKRKHGGRKPPTRKGGSKR